MKLDTPQVRLAITAQWVTFEFGGVFSYRYLVPWQFSSDDDKTAHVNKGSAESAQKTALCWQGRTRRKQQETNDASHLFYPETVPLKFPAMVKLPV